MPAGDGPVELRIPARLEYLSTVRRLLEAALLPDWPIDRAVDFVLAVSEATANAIEAQPAARAEVDVRCRFDGEEVEVVIEDHGPGLDPAALAGATDAGAGPAAHTGAPGAAPGERGRGLPIMRALADDLTVHGSAGGTRVRLLLRR